MIITAVKTPTIRAGSHQLIELLDEAIPSLSDKSVVAITSKVVSLCRGGVIDDNNVDFDSLIRQKAEYFALEKDDRFGSRLTIINNTLIRAAGIDKSNSDNKLVVWLEDFQAIAEEVRLHLCSKHNLKSVGVIITDSASTPLRRGSSGICLAHSGFQALKDYRGQEDLFGRPMNVSVSNIASGLAAAAVVCMGEGTESTPIAVITGIDFVSFQNRPPTDSELAEIYVSKDDDIYEKLLNSIDWQSENQ